MSKELKLVFLGALILIIGTILADLTKMHTTSEVMCLLGIALIFFGPGFAQDI